MDAIAALVAIADHGSFSAAARVLRVSPQAVSRAIAALEARLGSALFHRSTRAVRLTDEGAIYLERCRQALAELDAGERAVRGRDPEPHGLMVVTAPTVFGRRHIVPVVARLLRRHPRLRIRLVLTDRFLRLVEEGIDVAVRIGPLADSALRARTIGAVQRVLVASPAYLAAHGNPDGIAALRDHRIVAFSGIGDSDDWQFGEARDAAVHVTPQLIVNDAEAAILAAEQGVGIARVLSYQVAPHLASGALVRVLADAAEPMLPVSLLFSAARAGSANVRAFIEEAATTIDLHPSNGHRIG